jgi:hypothetical protein
MGRLEMIDAIYGRKSTEQTGVTDEYVCIDDGISGTELTNRSDSSA